jgi:hypothetical protein
MIVEGIIFRVVTANHPGDPALDHAGPIRTEYLATPDEPWTWCLKKDEAFKFTTHSAAETLAGKIGPRCHVSTVTPDDGAIPEYLRSGIGGPPMNQSGSDHRRAADATATKKKRPSTSPNYTHAAQSAEGRRDPYRDD